MNPNQDPVETNPDEYRVIFKNEQNRVHEYKDFTGDIIFIELKNPPKANNLKEHYR